MADLEQSQAGILATSQNPDSTRSTFKSSLQKFAFESPPSSSPRSTRNMPAKLAQAELESETSKDKPAPISRRLTRSTTFSTPASLPTPTQRHPPPPAPSPATTKRKRPSSSYAPPSKYAHLTNNLVDALAPNLICVFIGVNPGLRTATMGHAYSHPSNLFWKLLHSSGCTPRRCTPSEDRALPRLYALGHTNIVTRPTKDAAELSKAEMDAGVGVLEAKMLRYRPEAVCIVGKSIWESVWRVKHGRGIRKEEFGWGWQEERMGVGEGWEGARVFVATSTSGLAASMRPEEKEAVWRGLGEWVERRRRERGKEGGLEGEGEGTVEEKAAGEEIPK